jgi:hypothetical protein
MKPQLWLCPECKMKNLKWHVDDTECISCGHDAF